MDEKETSSKVIAFDTLFTTNRIQILKVLMTYMEPYAQKQLAIYIKLSELQYTLDFFHKHPDASLSSCHNDSNLDASKLCDEILPLCNPEERNRILQMKNMYQSMQQMQEMMDMIQMMKDMFPEGSSPFGGDMSDLFSTFTGGDNADALNLFNLFNNQENGEKNYE